MSCRRNCGYALILLATFVGATTAAEDAANISLTPRSTLDSTDTGSHQTVDAQANRWPQAWNETRGPASGMTFERPSRTNAIMGRTMLVTAGLAAACLVAMVWNRRRETRPRKPNSAELQLLGTLTLAPRCYLQLVSINEQQFLVARDSSVVRSVTSVGGFQAAYDSFGDPSEPPLGDAAPAATMPAPERRPLSTAFQQGSSALHANQSVSSSSNAGISLNPTHTPSTACPILSPRLEGATHGRGVDRINDRNALRTAQALADNLGGAAATSADSASVIGFENLAPPLQIALFLGSMALLTALLVSVTSFTRIVIVLSFVRRALTTQEIPPNPSLIGLALFMTFFTMGPVLDTVNEEAIQPLIAKEIQSTEAITISVDQFRHFMLYHTRQHDLQLFLDLSGAVYPETPNDTPTRVLVPAFMISEMKTAFIMGFCIYVPFILIDLLVSTVLMSLGMMMMPPVVVSAPIKLLLFVLVDGWHLVAKSLGASFA